MARENVELYAFNRGVVSKHALARTDIKRVSLSAEEQMNWMPRVLGSMSLRPGLEYLDSAASTTSKSKFIPFKFSADEQALIEVSDGKVRIWQDDTPVTFGLGSEVITNGDFTTDVSSWTDADDAGCTSSWVSHNGTGHLSLLGTGTAYAKRTQASVFSPVPSSYIRKGIRVVVTRGVLRVATEDGTYWGATYNGEEVYAGLEMDLPAGEHFIFFYVGPSGTNNDLHLSAKTPYATLVESVSTIQITGAGGCLQFDAPWTEADLPSLRWDQSGDVVFIACEGYPTKRIERRLNNSWSLRDLGAEKGPFRSVNTDATITMTPSAITGSTTISCSDTDVFYLGHLDDSLIAINSVGQAVTKSITAANTFSEPIEVSGTGNTRAFAITISGSPWVATVTLQRTTDPAGTWTDVANYTSNQNKTYNDKLDNQTWYYRIGVKTGGYTSGTITAQLAASSGTLRGIARIESTTTTAAVHVLTDFGALTASSEWALGAWSGRYGYPSAVALHDGRLWLAGKDSVWGSVSDDFTNFDDTTLGDAGPISRSIGSGMVDTVQWLVSSRNLVMGGEGSERTIRSTVFGEPITPTNFNMPETTGYGSYNVNPVKIDSNVLFVDRSGSRVIELAYDGGAAEYAPTELTSVVPELLRPYVVAMAAQRRPDTRVHFVLSDGTVALLLYDKNEDVRCWVTVETDGVIEDVVVLHGTEEDQVYYAVARTINGSTVRYLEKWAKESECIGGTDNKQADAFYYWSGTSSTTITGLSHLEGETVVCWANGKDLGTYTVASGQITISGAATSAVVGLAYQARYKSSKLAYAGQAGTALTQRKRVDHIGLILANTHAQGVQYGTDYTHLDDLPLVEDGAEVDADYIWEAYDKDSVEFSGTYDTDSRICLVANAPRPATVLAAVVTMTTHDKV